MNYCWEKQNKVEKTEISAKNMSKIKIKFFSNNLNGYNSLYLSTQSIYLNQVEISKIVISDEF